MQKTQFSMFSVIMAFLVFVSCSSGNEKTASTAENTTTTANEETANSGKVSAELAIKHVELTLPLNQEMVKEGLAISEMKCTACHSLEENRLVGPGWKNITTRRAPEWIMNMITNVDVMLAEDEEAQKLFEECLVRMPNQNISVAEARSILEFMRHNDGVE